MTKMVDEFTVKHVAALGRLQLAENEVAKYQEHLQKILNYMDELSEVDTQNISPLFSPVREHYEMYEKALLSREDKTRPSLPVDEILKNAPQKHQNQFKVEAVIEEN